MTGRKVMALAAVLALAAATIVGMRFLMRRAGGVVQPPSPQQTEGPVRITFWHGMADDSAHGKAINELVKQFNATHKEIQVEARYQGSYADLQKKTLAAVASGDGPTVIQATDVMLPDLAAGGVIRPLDGLVPAAELSDYPANLLEQVAYKGQHYALPLNRSALVLFYNKELVPNPPRTWAEFQSIARDVSDDETFGTAINPDGYAFAEFFLGAGGQWLDGGRLNVAGPAGVEALSMLKEMVDEGSAVMLKPKEYQSDYFNQGRAAMIISTSASLAYMKPVNGDAWGVAPAPAGPDGVRTFGSGANVAILSAAKPAEAKAATIFITWLTGRDATLQFAMARTGYGPVRLSALKDPRWTSFVKANPDMAVIGTALTQVVPTPNVKGWDQVMKYLTTAVNETLVTDRPAGEALADAAAAAQAAISKQ